MFRHMSSIYNIHYVFYYTVDNNINKARSDKRRKPDFGTLVADTLLIFTVKLPFTIHYTQIYYFNFEIKKNREYFTSREYIVSTLTILMNFSQLSDTGMCMCVVLNIKVMIHCIYDLYLYTLIN